MEHKPARPDLNKLLHFSIQLVSNSRKKGLELYLIELISSATDFIFILSLCVKHSVLVSSFFPIVKHFRANPNPHP